MVNSKQDFLLEQAMQNAIIASLQHGSVYKRGVAEKDKVDLRRALRDNLTDFAKQYDVHVSEAAHEKNIIQMADTISAACGACLVGGRLRIGIAQKALNLYLKYLWCLGQIQTPPHCPFDSRVMAYLPSDLRIPWTRLDNIATYRAWVAAAKKKTATGQSLAEWELVVFQGA